MKKIFITSVVALALVLGGASSAQAAFSSYLTVGSTGADVVALQTWLIDHGFSIPSITAGTAAKGYFGQQTKAAVIAYQASVGLPNTGFVGPLTIAKLNAGGGAMTPGPVVCPIGFNCIPNTAPVPVCPIGYNCTPVAGTPNPVGQDGTDGSLTVSLSSFAGNTTIKKGETKDMVAVKLQATAGTVSVTRFDVRFNLRPWLYFNTITLKDSAGTVIATKNLSGQSDATEITVGSDYLVRFEGINVPVMPGTDKTLVVSGTVLSSTDKLTSDVNVIVSVPNSSIRTINGKGYTDSIGLGTVAVSGTTGRTITLSSSGSIGNILVKNSSDTPDTRIVNTSTSGETAGVIVGKFDFKSENRESTLNTLTFTLNSPAGQKAWSTVIKRLYLTDGTNTYQVDSVASSSVFSNLNIKLPENSWKSLTILADVADQDDFTAGAMASSSITVNTTNIVGVDSSFTTVTASGANTVSSNNITFLPSGASVTNQSATAVLNDNGTSRSTSATIGYRFTFNNTGSNDLYIAKDPNTAFATSSTFAVAASSTLVQALTATSPTTEPNDSSTVWAIPAGKSRTFVYTGTLNNTNGTQALHSTQITTVYFDDDTTGLQEFSINFGLDALKTPPVSI